jgi:CheY-like chemotaxis protein
MTAIDSAPRLLLAEDDADTLDFLRGALGAEGYRVTAATSLAEALALIQQQAFDVILTDLFRCPPEPPLQAVLPLLDAAEPIPVAVMTAWDIPEQAAQRAGFACLLKKPFDLDEVIAALASCLNVQLTPEQEQQVATVDAYFAALSQGDIERALRYFTEDMVYQPPVPTRQFPHARLVHGKDDYRAYLQEALRARQDVELARCGIFPHPTGLVARYTIRWTAPDASRQQATASLVFRFAGSLIRQLGMPAGKELLAERLAQRPEAFGA